MKYIFFGGKAIGNYILDGLLNASILPVGVVCYRNIIEEENLDQLRKLNIEILTINKFKKEQNELTNFIKQNKADTIISVAFPFILSKDVLTLVRYPVNIHTGAIPKYRGHHPLSAALLNDEPYQATTVHLMAEEVDAGDILLQDFIKVENEDTILSIREKLMVLSLTLIKKAIHQLSTNTIYPKKQIGDVIWAPKRTPEDSKINWAMPSRYTHNFIRALVDPYPNAFTFRNQNEKVNLKKSFACNTPGKVIAKTTQGQYIISTADGVVLVETDTDLNIGEILT
ncbi:methionyl-tRNA formyltransferase [Cyclobacterium xiamenense]|uniref:methionyl-tRNA formyltransferase n=1 Tax=Cyclobacterium xiamenense TaxID=1297121 RepID=UPI0035CEAE68